MGLVCLKRRGSKLVRVLRKTKCLPRLHGNQSRDPEPRLSMLDNKQTIASPLYRIYHCLSDEETHLSLWKNKSLVESL